MTAKLERADGYYRAVCKDDKCRASNAQRNYWRGPHMQMASATVVANEHNRTEHRESP
jgi:hypothetical protein